MAVAAVDDIHSNAYNFLSFITSGVDPRTGVYTCNIAFSQVLANDLGGPAVPLVLAYSPLQTKDVGFGTGWSLQLSTYDGATHSLHLSSGDSYKAEKTPSALHVKDQKLQSFRVAVEANDDLRVEHKSGLVEVLSSSAENRQQWLPSAVHSPEGRSISLKYTPWGRTRYLSQVTDDNGTRLLLINRTSIQVTLTVWPDDPDRVLIAQMVLRGLEVIRIELTLGVERPSWRIEYETRTGLRVISRMESPAGGLEVIQYHSTGIPLPRNAPVTHLPCVAQHLHYPLNDQPVITRDFNFAVTNSNNYLGYGAPNLTWTDDGDNLYKVLTDYRYSSTETLVTGVGADKQELRRVLRTYNRFHLLVVEQTRQGGKLQTQTIEYHEAPGQSFADQPAQCQLPKRSTLTYRDERNRERVETTLTDFDDFANPIRTVAPSGAIETLDYYPVAGEAGLCPPDPLGFVRSVKSKTQVPAPGYAPAPVLSTHFRYELMPSLRTAGKSFLVLVQEQLREGATVLTVADKIYKTDTARPWEYARLAKETVTINGYASTTTLAYEKASGQLKTTTRVTGHDLAFSESYEVVSLLTGLPAQSCGSTGVVIRTVHDKLGRIISETVAPETAHAATRTYDYTLASTSSNGVETHATDASGAKKTTRFDGLGREVLITLQDIDAQPVVTREVYSASYDVLGQLVRETTTDWFGGVAMPLESRYAYDDWGSRSQTTGPDLVVSHSQADPIDLSEAEWLEGAGKIITRSNLLGKPYEIVRQVRDDPGEGTLYQQYEYDGLGRCTVQRDALMQTTAYTYDFANRLLQSILPDGTLISRTYARHSTDDLPIGIKVLYEGAQYPLDYVAGEQTFDGLGRQDSLTVAGRKRTWSYVSGQPRPSDETTPAGVGISFEYAPALNNQMIERRLPATVPGSVTYAYGAVHAQMIQASTTGDNLYDQQLEYFPSGKLKREIWPNGPTSYAASHSHSLQGLARSYTDVFGQEQQSEYDAAGRLSKVINGTAGRPETVEAVFSYNAQGLTSQVVTTDGATGRSLTTALEYDDFARETKRTLTFSGEVSHVLIQRFDATDKLVQRTLSNPAVLREEGYEYDARGRLCIYRCSGSQAPVDGTGKIIVSQIFEFDALDNVRKLTTVFKNSTAGSEQTDIATYHFDYPDKTQLSRIEHSHPDYAAQNVTLHYNADGHQTNDEQGRTLDYDPLGRLTSVSAQARR